MRICVLISFIASGLDGSHLARYRNRIPSERHCRKLKSVRNLLEVRVDEKLTQIAHEVRRPREFRGGCDVKIHVGNTRLSDQRCFSHGFLRQTYLLISMRFRNSAI